MTSTDLMNVEAFANITPSAAFAGLNPESENLADGIGSSYGVIGYKGKVWTLRLRGETYTFVRPDDGSPAAFLDAIILRSAPYKSKSFYAGGYNEGVSGERPTCSALDGVTPDADVKERQAAACAICPRNEWKTDANGRKGRDCSDYKRLALLILPSQSKALLGSPLIEPVFLRVPAASLNDLAILGEAMAKKGFHYSTYVTRIGFQMDKPHPQMTFRAIQALTEKEAPTVMKLREDPVAFRVTGENEEGKQQPYVPNQRQVANGNTANSASQTQPASSSAAQQRTSTQSSAPVSSAPSEDDEEAKLLAQLEAARKKKAAAAAAQNNVEIIPPKETPKPANTGSDAGLGASQEMVEVGFDGLDQPAQPTKVAAPTTNTVEDTGPAEESDADLDARVAALL